MDLSSAFVSQFCRSSGCAALASLACVSSRIKLEIDAERDLIFKTALLQSAALLYDDEPGKIMKRLAGAAHGHFDGVRKALVGSSDDLNSFETVSVM